MIRGRGRRREEGGRRRRRRRRRPGVSIKTRTHTSESGGNNVEYYFKPEFYFNEIHLKNELRSKTALIGDSG